MKIGIFVNLSSINKGLFGVINVPFFFKEGRILAQIYNRTEVIKYHHKKV